MNELSKELNIETMIYEIRGKQIMLDSDLAKLYQCSNGTKSINQAVTRHTDRFPNDFYFQITENEYICLKSQLGTSNETRGGVRKLPYAFTEQGVAMLATILRTSVAAEVSIKIMRAFVAMRKYISTNLLEQKYINNLVLKHEEEINKIFDHFDKKQPTTEIYFYGQIYDAYSKLIDLMSLSKQELIIIDSYADKHVLDMISKLTISVTIILSNQSRLTELDINKYNQQYNNLTIIYNDTFHDRFLIIDKKEMYHLGTSLNNAGTKTFSINKIEDARVINFIINLI